MGTAKRAVTLGHFEHPNVKQVAVSPHNVGIMYQDPGCNLQEICW
uniref:GSVIVT00036860001 n=1 Tax=Arundo donax TaxID=35708 RepID=A0A0A9FN52_ARUDO